MWKTKETHFAGDYFFQEQSLATSTAYQVSDAFELGNTEGGIRVHGYLEGAAVCASGNTVKTELEVADTADSTAWTKIAENTITAGSTSLSGDTFTFIPDVAEHFMRVKVANATGMTGKFTVAVELVP